jgi:hypothetical protein
MKTIDQLTKTEKSLLLFMECAAVDHGGIYQPERTNTEDREIMDRWKAEGFIDHGRLASEHLKPGRTVWCSLSVDAMEMAHSLRKELAARMWENRTWISTAEKRDAA